MPWQNTMLGLVSFILLSFLYGCGEVNWFISRPLCAITPAATVLPPVKLAANTVTANMMTA
jgi:hypothetical protein